MLSPAPPDSTVTGVVLAGGASRRMGSDKARLQLPDGSLMIKRVLGRLSKVCARAAVVVDRPDRYADLALQADVIVDTVPRAGPLSAVCDAVDVIETDSALVVACDMPHLDIGLLRHMLARPRTYDALVPIHNGKPQVLHAIYTKRCLPHARQLLAAGDRSLQALVRAVAMEFIEEDEWRAYAPAGASFTNLNAPARQEL